MPYWIWIGCGGFVGAVLRHVLSLRVDLWLKGPQAAWGIFTVNLIGCLAIGLASGWADSRGMPMVARSFFMTGVLGGFTTYSTFALEGCRLFREGLVLTSLLYVSLHVVLGLACAGIGYALVTRATP